jgi:hypothetical protein
LVFFILASLARSLALDDVSLALSLALDDILLARSLALDDVSLAPLAPLAPLERSLVLDELCILVCKE